MIIAAVCFATGISQALTSTNPEEQASATAASSIAESIVQAVAQATKQTVS